MNAIVQFLLKHGYSVLFAAVFARQIGLPLPAPLFLLAAGALAAGRGFRLVPALGLAVIACVLADWAWYEAGRQWAERVLHFIHRFAPDPEATDQKSKKVFARYGPQLLLVAKFVPGLDAIAPPLAGASRTGRFRFLAFETIGASLWSTAYTGLGYVFSNDLDRAAAHVGRAGTLLAAVALVALAMYAGRKLIQWRRFTREPRVVRITLADPIIRHSAFNPCSIVEGLDHEH